MSSTEPQPSSEVADKLEASINYFYEKQYPHLVHREALKAVGELRQAQAQVENEAQVVQFWHRKYDEMADERDGLRAELATANEQNAFLREQYQGLFANTVEREEHERVMAERDEAKRGYEIALDQWNEHREDNYRLEARVRELERALREIEGAGGGLVHHALRERARAVLEAKGESNAKSG